MLLLNQVKSFKWAAAFSTTRSVASHTGGQETFVVKSKLPDIKNMAGITLPEHLAAAEKPSWKTSIAFVWLNILNIKLPFRINKLITIFLSGMWCYRGKNYASGSIEKRQKFFCCVEKGKTRKREYRERHSAKQHSLLIHSPWDHRCGSNCIHCKSWIHTR